MDYWNDSLGLKIEGEGEAEFDKLNKELKIAQ